MRLITSIGVGPCYREFASLRCLGEEVLHGDAKPLLSDVLPRPVFSMDIMGAAARAFEGNAKAVSETLDWPLFRSRSSNGLLRMLVVRLMGLCLAGDTRRWNADHIRA